VGTVARGSRLVRELLEPFRPCTSYGVFSSSCPAAALERLDSQIYEWTAGAVPDLGTPMPASRRPAGSPL
jgi:hypothetical protein